MLKPIQTKYRGFRMRSRLEARFAVVFDALEIRWEYEPQGYDLGEAGRYLPDFWFPELEIWVEIKGGPAPTEDRKKCMTLALESGKELFLFDQPELEVPAFRSNAPLNKILVGAWAKRYRTTPYVSGDEGDSAYWFAECMDCLTEAEGKRNPPPAFVGLVDSIHWETHAATHKEPTRVGCRNSPRMWKAYEAGRGARFEFGEKGGVSKMRRRPRSSLGRIR